MLGGSSAGDPRWTTGGIVGRSMDVLSQDSRRKCMSAIRSTNTGPELTLRRALHALGHRFRLHKKSLPGRPDIVFGNKRIVILVHGCFWHRHRCKAGRSTPASNVDLWARKLKGNTERDRRNIRRLNQLGWTVMVVWECQLKASKIKRSIERIDDALCQRLGGERRQVRAELVRGG